MAAGASTVYVISARRSALGRLGGLHRARRLEELARPVLLAALKDAKVATDRIEGVVVGNASAGGNPARAIALSAGLAEAVPALSIDREACSGLDAVLIAARQIAMGEAAVLVAGGAESLSSAPWRLARPKAVHQQPHVIGLESGIGGGTDVPLWVEAAETLAVRCGISRDRQDAWTLHAHLKAQAAREKRQLVAEIVPIRSTPDEARDQSAVEPSLQDLQRAPVMLPPDGTLTAANASSLHDGAAFVVLVSEAVWSGLGRPRALQLLASVAIGVDSDREANAPADALTRLLALRPELTPASLAAVETMETSAAQAIALAALCELDPDVVNPAGGAVVRGHPLGAAGAVALVRLFTDLVRGDGASGALGAVTQGAAGGLGVAALFQAVG